MTVLILILSAFSTTLFMSLAITSGLPAAAQTQACRQRSEGLLKQLGSSSIESIEALAAKQRQELLAQNCDPQTTGYDLAAENIKLNKQLGTRPEQKEPFRIDKLIRLEY